MKKVTASKAQSRAKRANVPFDQVVNRLLATPPQSKGPKKLALDKKTGK